MPKERVAEVQNKIVAHINEQRELKKEELKEPYRPLASLINTTTQSPTYRFKDDYFFAKSKASTVASTLVGGAFGYPFFLSFFSLSSFFLSYSFSLSFLLLPFSPFFSFFFFLFNG